MKKEEISGEGYLFHPSLQVLLAGRGGDKPIGVVDQQLEHSFQPAIFVNVFMGFRPSAEFLAVVAKHDDRTRLLFSDAAKISNRLLRVSEGDQISELLAAWQHGQQLRFILGDVVAVQLVLSEVKGDSKKAAEFNLGANPNIKAPIGYHLWDSKSYGNATFGIGDNRLIGGENEASLSWSFMIVTPAICVDGHLILENGHYTV